MSNTLVQIKRSTANAVPASLQAGELAYSYNSNVLFIGTSANTVLNIGGTLYSSLENASPANGASTLVRRYPNGAVQFSRVDVLEAVNVKNITSNTTLSIATETGSNGNVVLSANGVDVLRVQNNSYVGIGTNNPVANLHVIGNTLISTDLTVSGNLFVEGNTVTFNVATLEVEDNEIILNANTVGVPVLNASITVDRGTSTNTFVRWNEDIDKWGWSDNGSTFYTFETALNAYNQANNAYNQANTAYGDANTRVLKAGDTMTGALIITAANVGLNVSNSVAISNTLGGLNSGILVNKTRFFAFANTGESAGHPTFRSDIANSRTILRVLPNGVPASNAKSQFEFFAEDYFTTPNEWHNFRIIATNTNFFIDTSRANNSVQPRSINFNIGGSGEPGTANYANVLVVSTGNVGINVGVPTSNLHVVGTANITLGVNTATVNATTVNAQTFITSLGSNVYAAAISAYGQANLAYTQANSAYDQANNAYNDSNTRVLRAGDTMTGNLIMSGATVNTSTANISTIVTANTLALITGTGSNSNITFTANGTEVVRITNNRVGIGTTAPANTLHVVGTANVTSNIAVGGRLTFTSNPASPTTVLDLNNHDIIGINSLSFYDPGPNEGISWAGGTGWKIFESPDDWVTNSAGNLQFGANTTRYMTLSTSGLEVVNNVNAQTYFTSTGANVYAAVINAYGQANLAYTQANNAYTQANNAYGQANLAYTAANTSANTVAIYANDAVVITKANVNFNNTSTVNVSVTANTVTGRGNIAFSVNTTSTGIVAAYNQANNAYGQANLAYTQANNAYGQANNAYTQANLAYTAANNSNLLLGGLITGTLNVTQDLIVGGNIYLEGNTTYINVSTYTVEDSLIYLAANNNLTDSVDIGFIGGKNTLGTYSHTGLARDATDTKWKLFDNLPDEAHVNNVINFANSTLATLVANLEAQSILLGGNAVATNVSVNAAYFQANSAYTQANNAYGQANNAYTQANNGYTQANNAYGQANLAYTQANNAYTQANNAYGQANLAYTAANTSGNTTSVSANTGSTQRNVGLNFSNTSTVNVSVGAGTAGNANIDFTVNRTGSGIVAAHDQANNAYTQANNAYGQANLAYNAANNARVTVFANSGAANATTQNINFVNTSTILVTVANTSGNANVSFTATDVQANAAYTQANNAYGQANNAYTQANNAYGQANLAYTAANNRVLKAGDTMIGQLNISSGGLLVTGNSNFDSGTLFVDSVNDRIGVGTTGPTEKLDVQGNLRLFGTGSVNLTLEADTDNVTESDNPTIIFKQDGDAVNARIGIGSTNELEIVSQSGNGLYLGAGNTRNITIVPSGNVGIGTSTPTSNLYVVGNANITTGVNTATINATTLNVTTIVGTTSASGLTLSTGTGSNGNIIFSSNGTEDMRIAANGFVGIGTISPETLLQVGSTSIGYPQIKIKGSQEPSIYLEYGIGYAQLYNSYGTIGLNAFLDGEGKSLNSSVLYFRGYNDTANAYLQFFDSKVTITGTNNGSRVGIGTTNPATTLHVDASGGGIVRVSRLGTGSGILQMEADGTDGAISSTNNTRFQTNSTERMRITTGGNVGIGIENPTATLHVAGNTLITQDLTVSGNLFVEGNTISFNVSTLEVEDNEIVLNSNTTGVPSLNASITVDRGTSTNTFLRWNEGTDKWGWSDDGTTFYSFDTSLSAYGQANAAYTQANSAYGQANLAYNAANNARVTVFANNGAANATTQNINFVNTSTILVTVANTSGNGNVSFVATDVQANAAYAQANAAYTQANNAYGQANNAYTQANSAFTAANNRVLKAGDTMTGNLIMSGATINTSIVATTTTDLKLVSGTAGNVEIRLMPAPSAEGNLILGRTDGTARYHMLRSRNDTTIGGNYLTFDIHNGTFPDGRTNNVMTLMGTGNVGIGITTPTSNLHVVGNANITTGINTATINATTLNVTTVVGTSGLTLSTGVASNGNIVFSSNNTEDMRIVANGFVGIGTTLPAATLHVQGTILANSNIHYQSPNTTNVIRSTMYNGGTLSFEGNTGQLFSITDSMSGSIFSVNDISGIPSIEVFDTGEVRLAQYSGNVGIGVANATSKLHVVGNANITLGVNTATVNATTVNAQTFITSLGSNVYAAAINAYGQANNAYTQANNAYGQANLAYTAANNARVTVFANNGVANSTTQNINFVNTATVLVNVANTSGNANVSFVTTDVQANAAYTQANAAYTQANSAYGQANNAYTQANLAYTAANNAKVTVFANNGAANSTTQTINFVNTATIIVSVANTSGNANISLIATDVQANAAYTQANNAYNQANLAYTAANNSNLKSGGLINGTLNVTQDLIVGGNIYLEGNTTYINVSTYTVEDSLIYLAANNNLTDSVDIGFIGGKNTSGTYSHTGLARDATDTKWKLFDNLPDEAHVNNVINFANSTVATLVANLEAQSILLGGNTVATQANLTLAHNQANNAYGQANLAYTQANNAYGQANLAYTQANNAYGQANLAYTAANNRVLKAGDTMTGNLIMSGATINTSVANISTVVAGGDLTLSTGTGSNGNLIFSANGNEDIRIVANGFVGIGTTSASYILDANGSVRAQTSFLVGSSTGTSYGDDNLIKPVSSSAFLNIKGGAGKAKILIGNDLLSLVSGNTDNIVFRTGATSSTDSGTERMRVDINGNVSIGTAYTTSKFDVFGTNGASIRNPGGSAFLEIGAGATGNNFAYVDLTGDTTYTDFGLRLIRGAGGPNTDSVLDHRGTGALLLRTTEAGPITFHTTNSERMRIAANGWVAIGTSAPLGPLHVATPSSGNTQFVVADTANAVNYLQVTGSATGSVPVLSAQGSDTNVALSINGKGTGYINLAQNRYNYWQFYGADSGSGPTAYVWGSDSNIDMNFATRGTGAYYFKTSAGANTAFSVGNNANSVNYIQVAGAATGGGPYLYATGSDTNVQFNFYTRGSGGYAFSTGLSYAPQFFISHTASATNYIQITGAAAGNLPILSAQGSDTNVGINFAAKGAGSHRFSAANGEMLRVEAFGGTTVNRFSVIGSAAGSPPMFITTGSDTNVGMDFSTKGTGNYRFYSNSASNGTGNVQFLITSTASAVNYLEVTGSSTGSYPALIATGSDTNVGLTIRLKGAPAGPGFRIENNNGANVCFAVVTSVASPVNYVRVDPAAAGTGPTVRSEGGDTNSNLNIATKGTGDLTITTNASERMRVMGNGWIGIGTSSPTNIVHINDSAATGTGLRVDGGGTGSPMATFARTVGATGSSIEISASGNDPQIRFTRSGAGNYHIGVTSDGSLRFTSNNFVGIANDRVAFTPAGNVGIGTSSPSNALEISGGANVAVIRLTSTQFKVSGGLRAGAIDFRLGGDAAERANAVATIEGWDDYAGADYQGSLRFSTLDNATLTERVRITPTGNVGIGTTNPTERLHIIGNYILLDNNADAAGGLVIDTGSSAGQISQIILRDRGTDRWGVRKTAANNFDIFNNATSAAALTIDASSNVGIGTTSTTYKLEVNGSFAATTKSFVINHPTKPGKKLRYGSLEGPENGVYVRGVLNSNNVIELPEHWTGLVDENSITVNLTPIGKHQNLYVEKIKNNCVYVKNGALFSSEINCFYTVFAERKDVEKLTVEY